MQQPETNRVAVFFVCKCNFLIPKNQHFFYKNKEELEDLFAKEKKPKEKRLKNKKPSRLSVMVFENNLF